MEIFENLNQKKILEIHGDLFKTNDHLAHCVSKDFKMGAGIALLFKNKFGQVEELKQHKKEVGQVASLKIENRYIFYLVTKELYFHKPTILSVEKALQNLKQEMEKIGLKSISIPRLGCGLDKLQWTQVKKLIEKVFADSEIQITVYFV